MTKNKCFQLLELNRDHTGLRIPNKRIARRLAFALLGATVAFGSMACGDDDESLTVAPSKSKKDAPVELPPEDAFDDDLGYNYDAVGRRDPFTSYLRETSEEKRDESSFTELQRYELDNLTLVAVVVGTATPMAMVQDPEGKGHTVKIGTLIGKRFGQIKHIRRGEIEVQEEFRDYTGQRIPVKKSLTLRQDVNELTLKRR